MSWATCYSGSNNIHFNYPPIMSDGRIYSSWQPTAYINDQMKKRANIVTNWEYRQYLTHNAHNLMKHNSLSYCNELGLPFHQETSKSVSNNVPYRYKSIFDMSRPGYGYSESTLKNPYLTREQLSAKMTSPTIYYTNFQPNGNV